MEHLKIKLKMFMEKKNGTRSLRVSHDWDCFPFKMEVVIINSRNLKKKGVLNSVVFAYFICLAKLNTGQYSNTKD